MRALAGIALALALVSPASAATVARTTPEAGPVLAGPEVLWGTEGGDGSVRVMAGTPGRPPRLLHRVAAATGEETTRGIGPLAASADAFAVRVPTSTLVDRDFDSISYVGEDALLGGPLRGGASLLFGALPERVEQRACEGRYELLGGFSVDGARYAIGSEYGPCVRTDRTLTRLSIAVFDGGTRRVVEAGTGTVPFEVQLAGRFLAWVRESRELVLHDLESGATVARIRARDLRARGIGGFALQPDGALVFTAWALRYRRGSRLAALIPGRPGVRLLDRHASGRVALADGRVLYERVLDDSHRRTAIVLKPIAGGPAQTLTSLGARRDLAGPLDIDGTRATWAVDRGAGVPGRIVLREL